MTLNTTNLDVKYVFPKNEKLELVLGGNYMFQENKNFGHEELIPDAEKTDYGIFGLTHIHGDNIDLILGLRGDFRQIKTAAINKSYNSFNASVGLKKELSESSIVRLNLASGYRAPNLAELFSDGMHHGTNRYEIGDSSLSEEVNYQLDFSFTKYSSTGKLGYDLYYNSIDDYIFLSPTTEVISESPVYRYVQSDATLFGGEFFYSRQTSVDWLSYETALEFVSGKEKDGNNLPYMPPLSFNQTIFLDFEKTSYQIEALFKDNQKKVAEYESQTDSYFLLNFSLSKFCSIQNQDDLTFSFAIENIFNTKYYDHLSRLKTMNLYDMGRNISLNIKYDF